MWRKVFALLFVTLVVVMAAQPKLKARSEEEYRELFRAFMEQYGKSYARDEFPVYYRNFKENLDLIEKVREPRIDELLSLAFCVFVFLAVTLLFKA